MELGRAVSICAAKLGPLFGTPQGDRRAKGRPIGRAQGRGLPAHRHYCRGQDGNLGGARRILKDAARLYPPLGGGGWRASLQAGIAGWSVALGPPTPPKRASS